LTEPSASAAVAVTSIDAGAVKVASAAGVVSETDGGWFVVAGVDTIEMLSIVDVVAVVAFWLVTARPTYTDAAIVRSAEPISVHDWPSAERYGSK
jgi:hypothetical protein